MKPRVKIYCINSIEEAKTAVGFGASAIGLVARMPDRQLKKFNHSQLMYAAG